MQEARKLVHEGKVFNVFQLDSYLCHAAVVFLTQRATEGSAKGRRVFEVRV